jgi:hypothetical protein
LTTKQNLTNADVKAGTTPAGHGAAPPGISFDRFVRACVVVKQLSEVRCVFFFSYISL